MVLTFVRGLKINPLSELSFAKRGTRKLLQSFLMNSKEVNIYLHNSVVLTCVISFIKKA